MAKILVFGTEGSQNEFSILHWCLWPYKENRSSHSAIYPQQKQPSRQTHYAIKPFTQMTQPTKPTQSDATAHTLATNMVSFTRLFSESLKWGIDGWFVAGLLQSRLRVRPRPQSAIFHDAENLDENQPCLMIIRHDLEPFLETGSAGRRPGQGRRRATTPNEDRYLVLTARRHRNMNATLLQQHLRSATGTTIRNRLHGVGLYARRPIVCIRLASRHRCDRREWATEHVNWRRNEWSNVLFSDESRFTVHPDNRRIFIWRDRGSRNNPAFVHESFRFGGGGVLVYGGISIDGRTDLYIIRDGPLTARRYRDEILRPIVVSPLRCSNRR
ncbi:transposable element Tcb2 transposase [Trichonephila clavipes]|nr:transposable element Tcb2 transposase [Trichonephila clavipes]